MNRLKERYIGDRAFYRYILAIAIPMIIQNGITNFVSLLDNIMVGQVGTLQMSAVSIANQFIFIFNLCIFGAVSGAGIFTAQFHGNGNHEGIRYTFRFKVLIVSAIVIVGSFVFFLFGDKLISLYLQAENNSAADKEASMYYGVRYLRIMVIGLPAFALCNAYSGTLRESEQTRIPMLAGVIAVLVNLCLNYVLIFGHFGAPKMGVEGAAVATVVSRYVELAIIATWTHRNYIRHPFIVGAYRSMYIPKNLLIKIIIKGMPLMVNEALWSTGMALINQSYSFRGLDVVAATNITSTVYNLSSVIFMSMGNAVGIITGRLLGAGKKREEVIATNRKLVAFSVFSCLIAMCILLSVSGVFPKIYNTTEEVQTIATKLICINAFTMCLHAYANAAYFTLRSGGQTMITFLFDCCFVWCVSLPVTFLLCHYTALHIVTVYAICESTGIIKVFLGTHMIKKGKWINNLVAD